MAKRALLAEDDFAIARVLQVALGAGGYDVFRVVQTGEGAVHFAFSEQPDLVLLDVSLAGAMNGIDAAERVRRRSECPVVFHTAHRDLERLARMQAVRRSAIVHKPSDVAQLLKAMSLLVNAEWVTSRLGGPADPVGSFASRVAARRRGIHDASG